MFPIGDDNSMRRTFPLFTYAPDRVESCCSFFVELGASDAFIERWAFVPARFLSNPAGELITIFTAMFMHAGWLHILGNMLYLWIFGDNVEDRLGHIPVPGLLSFVWDYCDFCTVSLFPGSNVPNLGASGAIAGVLGSIYFALSTRAGECFDGLCGDPIACAGGHRVMVRVAAV